MTDAHVLAAWGSFYMLVGSAAVIGLIYCAIVVRRAHRQTGYQPVLSDWIWFTFLPCIAYAALAAAGMSLRTYQSLALFSIATAALGLLLIGIHNAWDTVTHIVVTRAEAGKKKHKHSH